MAHPRSRIVALVIGAVLLLPAFGVFAAGAALGVVAATQRDSDGYFELTLDPVATASVAVTAGDLQFAAEPGSPDWLIDWFDADIRLRVAGIDPDTATFVGIARTADVDRYLADTAHVRVVELDGRRPIYDRTAGGDRIGAPTTQDFWVADAVGTDTLEIDWEPTAGRWSAVVMNADGSPGVAAEVDVGLRVGAVVPIAIVLFVVGVLLLGAALVLIVVGAWHSTGTGVDATSGPAAVSGPDGPHAPPASSTLPPPVPTAGTDPPLPGADPSAPAPELQEAHR